MPYESMLESLITKASLPVPLAPCKQSTNDLPKQTCSDFQHCQMIESNGKCNTCLKGWSGWIRIQLSSLILQPISSGAWFPPEISMEKVPHPEATGSQRVDSCRMCLLYLWLGYFPHSRQIGWAYARNWDQNTYKNRSWRAWRDMGLTNAHHACKLSVLRHRSLLFLPGIGLEGVF